MIGADRALNALVAIAVAIFALAIVLAGIASVQMVVKLWSPRPVPTAASKIGVALGGTAAAGSV